MLKHPLPLFSIEVRGRFLWVRLSTRDIVFMGWPVLKAWTRRPGKDGWTSCNPFIDIATGMVAPHWFMPYGIPYAPLRRILAGEKDNSSDGRWERIFDHLKPVREFFSSVPPEVREVVIGFSNRQWQLMQLLQRGSERARQLVVANPALGYGLAMRSVFKTQKVFRIEIQKAPEVVGADFTEVLCWRRCVIAGYLGFPASEATVALLAKIRPEDCRLPALFGLRDRLRTRWIQKTLAHLSTINGLLLEVLRSKYYESLTPKFLLEVATLSPSPDQDSPAYFLIEAGRRHQELYQRPLPENKFRSLGQLMKLNQELTEKLETRRRRVILSLQFPESPLPVTPHLIPLSSPTMLLQEGEEQHHCVSDYAADVAKGTRYFYKLLAPQRGTVGVQKTDEGWRLQEALGTCNAPLEEATIQSIKQWLEEESAVGSM